MLACGLQLRRFSATRTLFSFFKLFRIFYIDSKHNLQIFSLDAFEPQFRFFVAIINKLSEGTGRPGGISRA